ncbi:hypothetical protein [Klebsiella grimontii]|nr:hypothetical protein [Klebsiella grimontii]
MKKIDKKSKTAGMRAARRAKNAICRKKLLRIASVITNNETMF